MNSDDDYCSSTTTVLPPIEFICFLLVPRKTRSSLSNESQHLSFYLMMFERTHGEHTGIERAPWSVKKRKHLLKKYFNPDGFDRQVSDVSVSSTCCRNARRVWSSCDNPDRVSSSDDVSDCSSDALSSDSMDSDKVSCRTPREDDESTTAPTWRSSSKSCTDATRILKQNNTVREVRYIFSNQRRSDNKFVHLTNIFFSTNVPNFTVFYKKKIIQEIFMGHFFL